MTKKTPGLYRHYLAADLAQKRVESIGYSVSTIDIDYSPLLSDYVGEAGVPSYMRFPALRVEVTGFTTTWERERAGASEEEAEAASQEEREAAILAFAKFPGVSVFRESGNAFAYFEAFDRIGVRVAFGRALCERVQTGTRTVRKPADPELAAKLADALEHVEVEEPIFEWRCNDAELKGGAL